MNEEYGLELGPPARSEIERLERENGRLRQKVDQLNGVIGSIFDILNRYQAEAEMRMEPLRNLTDNPSWSMNPRKYDMESFGLIADSNVINLKRQFKLAQTYFEESRNMRFRMMSNDLINSICGCVSRFADVFVGSFSRYAKTIHEYELLYKRIEEEQARSSDPRQKRSELTKARREEAIRIAREIIGNGARHYSSRKQFAQIVIRRMNVNWSTELELAKKDGTDPNPGKKPLSLTAVTDALQKAKLPP